MLSSCWNNCILLAETQFLIRQTSADHDICVTVNPVTLFVEKQRMSSCFSHNKAHSWVIMPSGKRIIVLKSVCQVI